MENEIVIDGRRISENHRPYVIAEMSANHQGSLETAFEIIKSAKRSGVDAVKIQTYTPDTMTIDSRSEDFLIQEGLWRGNSLYDLYAEAQTPFEWHEPLFRYAKEIEITLFSSPFDETGVDLLASLGVPAYKIASFELIDLPLVAYAASMGKPMLMSTGSASFEEIGDALETARISGCDEIAIFHCISGYPTPVDQSNIAKIARLRKEFGVLVGLSDHTTGTLTSIVATSVGAALIEKHFTLSRAGGGVDSAFSLEPLEMERLVENTREAFLSLGDGSMERSEVEGDSRVFRRSLYFVKDLAQGEVISSQHIRRIRPGFGLPPKYFDAVVGRKVSRDVYRGEPVLESSLL